MGKLLAERLTDLIHAQIADGEGHDDDGRTELKKRDLGAR
jgi:hypothetical protein